MRQGHWLRAVGAALLMIVGAIFIGQGLGILQGRSVMVGDRTWAVIGAVLVLAGGWLAWRTVTRRRISG